MPSESPNRWVDRLAVHSTAQTGLAQPMRWFPDPADEDRELPAGWSWLAAGPGNGAPQ